MRIRDTTGARIQADGMCSCLLHAVLLVCACFGVPLQGQEADVNEVCQHRAQSLQRRMPEDWDYEEGIRSACGYSAEALCPNRSLGYAELTRCLRCALSPHRLLHPTVLQ